MNKTIARSTIKNVIKNLQNRPVMDRQIFENVIKSNVLFGNVLLYNALPSEVDTQDLINYCIKNTNVYLPVCVENDINLVKIDKKTQYKLGLFSIKEPQGDKLKPEDVHIDVCIVPLLGFDKYLNRLGKGKGYYDRLFEKLKCKKVGIAYSVQQIDQIDIESFDKKLDMVITEKGIIE